tara:strand:+ start:847 stop:1074 length:228 start_codon:yes stop_codon:yes gene_type:complete
MNYKTALINQGFEYSDVYGLFIKSHGFGQSTAVERCFGAHFICRKNDSGHMGAGVLVFDKEVKSSKEFQELISKL